MVVGTVVALSDIGSLAVNRRPGEILLTFTSLNVLTIIAWKAV